MIHVKSDSEYLFNPRYVRYVSLKINEDDNDFAVRIELTDCDHVRFTFGDEKEANKAFKVIKRKMEQ